MNFQEFIEKGLAREASKDKNLAKSLLLTAKQDLQFFGSLEINPFSARKVMTNYYDVLRSILEAISVLDGYKVYSHEAFTSFLQEIKSELVLAEKFDRFRKLRNGINYYGNTISIEEVKEIKEDIKITIEILINKYLGGLK